MRQSWILILVAVLFGVSGFFLAGKFFAPESDRETMTQELSLGQPLPPFTLGSLTGARVSQQDFQGQVVLINFWATWCKPCREEMPMLNQLQKDLGDQGFVVLGIAMDDVQRTKDFTEELGITYPILVGSMDVMAVGSAYGNPSGVLPYSVLADRQGRVQWTHFGELEYKDISRKIKAVLSKH